MRTFLIAAVLIGILIAARTNPDNSRAQVNQVQGLWIFTDCKPLHSFEYLGSVATAGAMGSGQYQPVRDRLIKKVKKEFPAADGMILYLSNGTADKCEAIKFR